MYRSPRDVGCLGQRGAPDSRDSPKPRTSRGWAAPQSVSDSATVQAVGTVSPPTLTRDYAAAAGRASTFHGPGPAALGPGQGQPSRPLRSAGIGVRSRPAHPPSTPLTNPDPIPHRRNPPRRTRRVRTQPSTPPAPITGPTTTPNTPKTGSKTPRNPARTPTEPPNPRTQHPTTREDLAVRSS